ncbi:PGF-CTERM sorting domain-containing protein [Salinigranum rubrum]|uniref:PGF-CTERM sorting domain-containing protein n=1 Tax=Salinigranum rubrum TaxID=755307 RepID=A0A2I8VLN6_9EURY|nr:PGF-CTERM sorting domain-containing protein [Salinigranum rubrum]AUV82831.1 PGF-CTERM sorting domain-containing protein [Salinigranum rubrum]
MPRDRTLAAGAVGLVAVALLVAAAVPGVLADPTDDGPTRPGPVRIAETSIAPGTVSGQTTVLHVQTRLDHRGNPTPNVSVRFRATDAESGFVAATETVDVGTLDEDGETLVQTNLTVEREGGYRIEATVFRDGERVGSGGKTVSGLEALTPEYARTSVGFTDSAALPAVSFSVASVSQNRTTLDLAATLTNRGDSGSENLRVTVVLRQADSNIVAARSEAQVGTIRPGRTETVETQVTVPSEYNYYIDAVLWKDGVVVDTARSAANLDPTERISVNETEREVELRVEDFSGSDDERPRAEGTEAQTVSTSAPGFGVGAAVAALLSLALVARRWGR